MEIHIPTVPYSIDDNSVLVLDNNYIIKDCYNFRHSINIFIGVKNGKLYGVECADPILEEVRVSSYDTLVVRDFEIKAIPKLVPKYILARSKLSNTLTDYADYKVDLARLSINKEELGNIVLDYINTTPYLTITVKLTIGIKFIDNKLYLLEIMNHLVGLF